MSKCTTSRYLFPTSNKVVIIKNTEYRYPWYLVLNTGMCSDDMDTTCHSCNVTYVCIRNSYMILPVCAINMQNTQYKIQYQVPVGL